MPKTLLQKVMKSCQGLNRAGIQSFDAESVANYFLYVYEFRTNDSDIIHAMSRRLFELVCIGLLTSTENKKGIRYSFTDLGLKTDCSKIHLGYKLVLRDNKDDDISKGGKRKSDKKPRSVRAESEVKNECKVLNGFACDHYGITSKVVFPLDRNTETLNTNKGTPKHSLREHIKSFF